MFSGTFYNPSKWRAKKFSVIYGDWGFRSAFQKFFNTKQPLCLVAFKTQGYKTVVCHLTWQTLCKLWILFLHSFSTLRRVQGYTKYLSYESCYVSHNNDNTNTHTPACTHTHTSARTHAHTYTGNMKVLIGIIAKANWFDLLYFHRLYICMK